MIGSINRVGDVVGILNQKSKAVEYQGGETNTATVNINDRIITVDAKIDTDEILEELAIVKQHYALLQETVVEMQADIEELKKKL